MVLEGNSLKLQIFETSYILFFKKEEKRHGNLLHDNKLKPIQYEKVYYCCVCDSYFPI